MINVNYALEAINITKKFPGVLANDNICLNVRPGEVLGLIGENGAGKSTLLKVLNGIYPHGSYTGTLKLDGEEIRPNSPHDAMRLGSGYVPQEINVLKYFSVAENIYMSDLELARIKKDKKAKMFVDFRTMYDAAEKLLKDNHIMLNPHADVRKLSIGQQQMLMIARALSPATVNTVTLDEENVKAEVYLDPEQVSLAIGKGGANIKLASMLTGYTIDVYRDGIEEEDDVSLQEFADDIEPWIIEELEKIGLHTARAVLGTSREDLIERTDLEEETIDEVIRILSSEFDK